MKFHFVLLLLVILFYSCSKEEPPQMNKLSFQEVELECIESNSGGSDNFVRIDTKIGYDSLYRVRFTEPLQSWLADNYDSLLEGVEKNYPHASAEEYDSIILNDYVYNFSPFIGTKDCDHPNDFDFEKYTLLGISGGTSGCTFPDLESTVTYNSEKRLVNYTLEIKIDGFCEPLWIYHSFILIEKPEEPFEVIFEIVETTI